MPLGLSGCCQDKETLFRDVFSFLMTVTGEGAGGRHRLKKWVRCFMVRFRESSVSWGFTFPAIIDGSWLANSVCCSMGLRSRLTLGLKGRTQPWTLNQTSAYAEPIICMESMFMLRIAFNGLNLIFNEIYTNFCSQQLLFASRLLSVFYFFNSKLWLQSL